MRNGPLTFKVSADVEEGRFCTINHANQTVAYTSAAAAADCISLGVGKLATFDYVAVQMLSDTSKSFYFKAGGTIAQGGDVEVGADGKGVAQTAGATVCINSEAAVDGAMVEGYNV